MIETRRLVALAGVVLALAGCSDSTQPEPGFTSGIRFRYSGLRTGEFSARGEPDTVPAAFAVEDVHWNELMIIGFKPVKAGEIDEFRFDIRNPKVGTVSCSSMTDCDVTLGWMVFSQLEDGRPAPSGGYVLPSSVRVTISSVTQDSVKGTFDMQLSGWVGGKQGQITITHGEFDIPIVRF